MLGDEDRVPPHGGLFAVIFRKIGRNSGIYKVKCVVSDGFEASGSGAVSILGG